MMQFSKKYTIIIILIILVLILILGSIWFYKRSKQAVIIQQEEQAQEVIQKKEIGFAKLTGLDKEVQENLAGMYSNTQNNKKDSDNDGIADGDENNYKVFIGTDEDMIAAGLDLENITEKDIEKLDPSLFLVLDPQNSDTDGDGLNDGDEIFEYLTNPWNIDSDGDGLKDGEEVHQYKTSPNNKDTDQDGLTDYEEIMDYQTDPLNSDTDGDGFVDGQEVSFGFNPLGE